MNHSLPQIIRFSVTYVLIELRNSYQRTYLGTLWRTLGTFAMIALLGLFFGAILKGNIKNFHAYMLSLGTGILVWEFLSTTLNQSCSIFSNQVQTLRHTRQPLSAIFLRIWFRNFLIFIQSTIIGVILYAALVDNLPAVSWAVLPGVLLAAVILYSTSVIVGIACIRFRDLPQLIAWISHILFFLTPIIWPAFFLGTYSHLNNWNPAFHLVELFRAPMLGHGVQPTTWVFGVIAALILSVGAAFAFRRLEKKVPFWL
jgi:ABC-type polysaccharide/polyol phosphate export permease